MSWLFDGIGTEIISIVISLIIGATGGGFAGYKIGIKRAAKQIQKAGDNSRQHQELKIDGDCNVKKGLKSKTSFSQSQKADDHAIQTQIGGINDGRR